MDACGWEAVKAFKSLSHYKQFVNGLEADVAAGKARIVPVEQGKGWGSAWRESWYECQEDRRVWRLVGPDPPFPGIFEPI